MFNKPTVFILGAGASWHYGYPTGEDLVKEVSRKALRLSKDVEALNHPNLRYNSDWPNILLPVDINPTLPAHQQNIKQWIEIFASKMKRLHSALEQVKPLVIDYFLSQNTELQEVGKMLIAWVLLEREKQSRQFNANRRLNGESSKEGFKPELCKDYWHRFIIHKLTMGCRTAEDLMKNKVNFVTFNYDTSLENNLEESLKSIHLFGSDEKIIRKFFDNGRLLHVYGQIEKKQSINFSSIEDSVPKYDDVRRRQAEILIKYIDVTYKASLGIRTIAPDEKELEEKVLEAARENLEGAKCIYILGYGFDRENSSLLRLTKHLRDGGEGASVRHKRVLFTNFNDSNRINKQMDSLVGLKDAFSSGKSIGKRFGSSDYYEKSNRDVYGAFEYDFDDIEN